MADRDDDTISIREDSFLARLVPQAADQLAEQHTGDFDAEASRARFRTWLTEHTESSDTPGQYAEEDAVTEAEIVDDGLVVGQAGYEDFLTPVRPVNFPGRPPDLAYPEEPETGPAPRDLLPAGRALGEAKIGLWGAPGSGKTTFLAALRHATNDPANGRWVIHPRDPLTAELMTEFTRALVINHTFPDATLPGSVTTLHWHLAGDLAGSRFDRRKLRRRAPVPSEFTLSLTDVTGEAYSDRAGGIPQEVAEEALGHLAAARGLVYFLDPLAERELRNSADYLNRTIIALSARMLAGGGLVNGYLPHHVSVCVTKFDDPDVFEQARRAGLVTFGPDGRPQVLGKDAELLFDMICDSRFWDDRRYDSTSARLVRDELKARFHPDRIRYYATSSIGFYQRPGRDPATGRPPGFDPDDYANVIQRDGRLEIRGPIAPINVLEPLLSLQERISGITRTRPLHAVPSGYTEENLRRGA